MFALIPKCGKMRFLDLLLTKLARKAFFKRECISSAKPSL